MIWTLTHTHKHTHIAFFSDLLACSLKIPDDQHSFLLAVEQVETVNITWVTMTADVTVR